MKTISFLASLVLALICWGGVARAQTTFLFPDPACNNWMVNPEGTNGAPLAIDNSTGGDPVIAPTSPGSVCGAMISNVGTNPMTCSPLPTANGGGVVVTATAGDIINPGTFHLYGWEIWPGVNCFASSSTTAYVQEIGKGQSR